MSNVQISTFSLAFWILDHIPWANIIYLKEVLSSDMLYIPSPLSHNSLSWHHCPSDKQRIWLQNYDEFSQKLVWITMTRPTTWPHLDCLCDTLEIFFGSCKKAWTAGNTCMYTTKNKKGPKVAQGSAI